MSSEIIKKRYSQLQEDRSPFLEDAYKCSELTIQFLLPLQGSEKNRGTPTLKKQHQSIGAMGVNNIANKLLLTLFPPNQPFFKLAIDDFTALDLAGDPEARSKIEQGFSAVERTATDFVERSGIRPPFEEALKHLIVTGNILIHRAKGGGIEIFHMDQYVVLRDPNGKTREIVLEEEHVWEGLPEDVQKLMIAEGYNPKNINEAGERDGNELLSMFTRIRKINTKMWQVTQEIEGIQVPVEGPNTFKDADNPWFALRFHAIKGSSWGRGYISNFLGDLDTLEQLWKSLTHGAKAMAFLLFMIRPGATIRPKDIIEKVNGGFVVGTEADVTVLNSGGKGNDFATVLNSIDRLTKRLAKALLMDESITRDAERVTAEEIRRLANALEESLGGFYSILTQDFQVPYLDGTLKELVKTKQIPPLPKEIKLLIITGLDALGRSSEADRLIQFSQELQAAVGPEAAAGLINGLDMARRIGAARGIDTKGLIKSEEQMAQEQEQAQQQATQEQALGPTINAAGKMAADMGPEGLAQAAQQLQQQ